MGFLGGLPFGHLVKSCPWDKKEKGMDEPCGGSFVIMFLLFPPEDWATVPLNSPQQVYLQMRKTARKKSKVKVTVRMISVVPVRGGQERGQLVS